MSNKSKFHRSVREGDDFGDDPEFDKSDRSVRDQLRQIARGKIDLEELDELELGRQSR